MRSGKGRRTSERIVWFMRCNSRAWKAQLNQFKPRRPTFAIQYYRDGVGRRRSRMASHTQYTANGSIKSDLADLSIFHSLLMARASLYIRTLRHCSAADNAPLNLFVIELKQYFYRYFDIRVRLQRSVLPQNMSDGDFGITLIRWSSYMLIRFAFMDVLI